MVPSESICGVCGGPWSKNGAKCVPKLRFVDFVKMSVSIGKTLDFEGLGRPGCTKWAPSGAHGSHLGLKVKPLEHFLGMQNSSQFFEAKQNDAGKST